MEFIVRLLYSAKINADYDRLTVYQMLKDKVFEGYMEDTDLMPCFQYIRKIGNLAAHVGDVSKDEAMYALDDLHYIVGEVCILLGLLEDYPKFAPPSMEAPSAVSAPSPTTQKSPEEISEEIVEVPSELLSEFAPRIRYTKFDVKHKRDEQKNQEQFIRASFREAGWPILNIINQTAPSSVGCMIRLDNGETIDYVLSGRDGKPLAIVDYSTSSQNIFEGIKKLEAVALDYEKKYGYKPIAYYCANYAIFVIDQLGYKRRKVFQIHSMEEMELLKLRRTLRTSIDSPQINEEICGRYYQKEAITAACKAFSSMRRKSLLVMATGTGKTRVSIALADVLLKANWVKNILFLADRTSLVRQAYKNFGNLLRDITLSVYTGDNKDKDPNARIIFSTYQSMMQLIDDETREFGIGRFDLIIIDEAHRSIFNKYGLLFQYFDALLLGLTATPRNEENKSSYAFFELPQNQPDYAYELKEAVADKFLVGFSILDKTTEKLRNGITYDSLSEEEKKKIEEAFSTEGEEEGFPPDIIDANALSKKIINIGTIDVMLQDLMKNGVKILAGDKIGKTIIFASSHTQAVLIAERFHKLYPYLGPAFCQVIDSQVEDSQTLIDHFGDREMEPQIAVSVDMMDTGIDVPDVLNLVFFKIVKSKIKFLQMVGRGTRLCPDVFGPGSHKQGFLIFDYFDNLRYFGVDPWSTLDDQLKKTTYIPSQTEVGNRYKLKILNQLQDMPQKTAFEQQYMDELKNHFLYSTEMLVNDNLDVQNNLAYVNKYRNADNWDALNVEKRKEIEQRILPLFPSSSDPAKVKSFDNIIYAIEAGFQEIVAQGKDPQKIRHGFSSIDKELTWRMEKLLSKKNIPEIVKNEALISSMKHGEYLLQNFSIENAEYVRRELRLLIRNLDDSPSHYIINVADSLSLEGEEAIEEKSYAEKAQEYIQNDSPALAKLRNLDPLTDEEKNKLQDIFQSQFGSPADCMTWTEGKPLLPYLRIQTGINDSAIDTKFGAFLNSDVLNKDQIKYILQIIDYTKKNGDITLLDLTRISPFCDQEIPELFDNEKREYLKQLVDGLHRCVM